MCEQKGQVGKANTDRCICFLPNSETIFASRRYVVTAASGSLNAQHSSRRNHLAQDFLRPDIDCLRRSSWMWFPMTGTAPLKDEEKQRLLALNDRGHVDADGATGTGPLTKCQRLKNPAMPTAMPLCWNITDTTESGTGLRFCTGRYSHGKFTLSRLPQDRAP